MITLNFDIQTAEQRLNFKKGLDYLKTLKLPFKIHHILPFTERDEDELMERLWVQNQLDEKYYQSGTWAKMSDDERQDVALAEMMLYTNLESNEPAFPESETNQFLIDLKNGKYAAHHQ